MPKSGKRNTIVVAVSEYSFRKALEEHFYVFPKAYNRSEEKEFIAFYRVSPISAITHYAKIIDSKTMDTQNLPTRDALIMLGHHAKENVVYFSLDPLVELKTPVIAEGRGIQGIKYTKLDSIQESGKISELY